MELRSSTVQNVAMAWILLVISLSVLVNFGVVALEQQVVIEGKLADSPRLETVERIFEVGRRILGHPR